MTTDNTAGISTSRTLITTLLVDISDVVMNIVVAVFTGSTVMLAEAMQGFADFTSVCLLMLGHKRAKKHSTLDHPFGYGKELYFWALISAFIIFSITASFSIYFGWQNIVNPEPINHLYIAYAVLIIAMSTNLYAFRLSAVKILDGKKLRQIWKAFFKSQHIATKITYVLDLMGSMSAALGLVALILYQVTGIQRFDGIGAVLIGCMLAVLAFILLISIKDLITGHSAPPAIRAKIKRVALSHSAVIDIPDLRTMIIGPEKYLINLDVHFKDGLNTDSIEEIIDEIKASIKQAVPGAYHIQLEPETRSSELAERRREKESQHSD